MEFLRAVGRFILAQLAILGFLLLAPAILVGVSLLLRSRAARGSNPGCFWLSSTWRQGRLSAQSGPRSS